MFVSSTSGDWEDYQSNKSTGQIPGDPQREIMFYMGKPIGRSKMIFDPHTIPLRMLCSVHYSSFTNTTQNTLDVEKDRRQQNPLCARMLSLVAPVIPLPAHALRHCACACSECCPCLRLPCPYLHAPFVIANAPTLYVMPVVFSGCYHCMCGNTLTIPPSLSLFCPAPTVSPLPG